MYCRRRAPMPGHESEEGVSHGLCPKCTVCMQLANEIKGTNIKLKDYIAKEGLKEEILEDIAANESIWQGDWTLKVDPEILLLFESYEREVKDRMEGRGELKTR